MKNKVFFATLAAAVTVPVIVAPVQAQTPSTESFIDVSPSNPYYDIIHEMRDLNIISGYEDGTFKPNEFITRKHAAALISRAKDLSVTEPFVKFKDVTEKNPYFEDIKKLQQAGIFKPDAKGNFNPNQAITRAEMAKILTIAFDLKETDSKDFQDVPTSHPANQYVRALYSNGITTGDNGLFKPDASLTRAHYAVFMSRALTKANQTALDLNNLSDAEIRALSDKQMGQLLLPYTLEYGAPSTLPKGETDRKALTERLKDEHTKYYMKHAMNFNEKAATSTLFTTNLNLHVTSMSDLLGISVKDYINLVNEAYTHGKVVTFEQVNAPRAFVIHYDYVENKIVTGLDSRIID